MLCVIWECFLLYTTSIGWSLSEQPIGSTVEYYYCINKHRGSVSHIYRANMNSENCFRGVFPKTNSKVSIALFNFSI